jgi:uncharacterized protein (UPF0276 family)
MSDADFLGAGVGFRRPHRAAVLEEGADLPDLFEIMPCHFFRDPARIEELASRAPCVFHDVSFSLATAAEGVEAYALERTKQLCDLAKPAVFSEHLSLTASPDGTDLGHLAPAWYTRELLDLVCDRVKRWQDTLGVPVAIETITAPFVIPEADYEEGAFFRELCERTGCGVLLDLSNVVINGHNFGFDPRERLVDYPLERVWQVHLAGGTKSGEWRVDSHSTPVDVESFRLLGWLRGRSPLRSIIIERDDHLPSFSELVEEARGARALWEGEA